jgi:hypothetical protein
MAGTGEGAESAQREIRELDEAAVRVSDKLLGLGLYKCEECGYQTNDEHKLCEVRDITQRVLEGEIMMSGECPECGCGIGCPSSLIPDHTLDAALRAMRERGWAVTVVKP